MTFQPKLSALTALLALTGALGLDAAHAAEGSLYDWQPCPDSLAIEGGEPPPKKWDLTISPFTHHWHSSNEHKPVKLIAMDSHLAGGRFCGLALFTNSFGQPSAYGYVGQQWNNLFDNPKLYTKVSAGFIYGYKGKHKDAIAFNQYGIAPAIIPSLGYAITPKDSTEVFLLGTAGLTFTYTRSF
jgi:hypothetical protein